MRRIPLLMALGVAGLIAACAPRTTPVPVVTSPRYPDFLRPTIPASLAATPGGVASDRAWSFLQAGDLDNADREVALALERAPGLPAASATAGYVALARGRAERAVPHFDRAIEQEAGNVAALMGKGQALLTLERDSDALAAFEAALTVDPSLTEARRRVDVLRFRAFERVLAQARDAASRGRSADAIAGYTQAIAQQPDSAFLYRELADIERRSGASSDALGHFRQSLRLEPGDVAAMVAIAEILETSGDRKAALAAYDDVLALEPSSAIESRRARLRAQIELEGLPPAYRAIQSAQVATRGDLAALLAVRLGPLIQPRGGDMDLLIDIRGHWAESWINAVAGAGILEGYADHRFLPSNVVTRVDLAQVVAAVLPIVGAAQNVRAWQSERGRFSDLSTSHLAYPAVSMAVASGVMATVNGEDFQPGRPVSGSEAVATVERLRDMAEAAGRLVSARP